jgi:hypothetical protein
MKTKILILALALVLLLTAAGAALANGGAEPARSVLSGGASDATGGATLRATLGQPVVGVVTSSGGSVVLGQGFWHGSPHHTYLPLIHR